MLVLTRKNGEIVHLGGEIEVKVLSISRNVVKLGFSAPPDITIRRQELPPMPRRNNLWQGKTMPQAALCLPVATY